MILMEIVPLVAENHVRIHLALDLLEEVFDVGPHRGEEALAERFDQDGRRASAGQEIRRARSRFALPGLRRREHDPVD